MRIGQSLQRLGGAIVGVSDAIETIDYQNQYNSAILAFDQLQTEFFSQMQQTPLVLTEDDVNAGLTLNTKYQQQWESASSERHKQVLGSTTNHRARNDIDAFYAAYSQDGNTDVNILANKQIVTEAGKGFKFRLDTYIELGKFDEAKNEIDSAVASGMITSQEGSFLTSNVKQATEYNATRTTALTQPTLTTALELINENTFIPLEDKETLSREIQSVFNQRKVAEKEQQTLEREQQFKASVVEVTAGMSVDQFIEETQPGGKYELLTAQNIRTIQNDIESRASDILKEAGTTLKAEQYTAAIFAVEEGITKEQFQEQIELGVYGKLTPENISKILNDIESKQADIAADKKDELSLTKTSQYRSAVISISKGMTEDQFMTEIEEGGQYASLDGNQIKTLQSHIKTLAEETLEAEKEINTTAATNEIYAYMLSPGATREGVYGLLNKHTEAKAITYKERFDIEKTIETDDTFMHVTDSTSSQIMAQIETDEKDDIITAAQAEALRSNYAQYLSSGAWNKSLSFVIDTDISDSDKWGWYQNNVYPEKQKSIGKLVFRQNSMLLDKAYVSRVEAFQQNIEAGELFGTIDVESFSSLINKIDIVDEDNYEAFFLQGKDRDELTDAEKITIDNNVKAAQLAKGQKDLYKEEINAAEPAIHLERTGAVLFEDSAGDFYKLMVVDKNEVWHIWEPDAGIWIKEANRKRPGQSELELPLLDVGRQEIERQLGEAFQ